MDSIYWVISRDCNQRCRHCYNDSEPGAPGLSREQVSACVAHLPEPADVAVGRVILSGGEVLVWPDLLFHALTAQHQRYGESTQLMVQTNGDLLNDALLDRILAAHVARLDVSGMDQYHPKSTLARRDHLEALFAPSTKDDPRRWASTWESAKRKAGVDRTSSAIIVCGATSSSPCTRAKCCDRPAALIS